MLRRLVSCGLITVMAAVAFSHGQTVSAQRSAKHSAIPIVADVKSTITISNPSGHGFSHTQNGHYFRSRDGRVREDSVFGSVIADPYARTLTFLNHAKKEATVIAMSDPDAFDLSSVNAAQNAANKHVTSLGEDTVAGHHVHKTLVEHGNARPDSKSEIWTAGDIHLPVVVKTTGPDRTVTKEYQNIQVADPDPQVFEIPKGYRILDKSQFTPPLVPRR